jgi:ParB family transcriptional regulator, chromosome partitioning protein
MAQKPHDRRGLGRGLSALMGEVGLDGPDGPDAPAPAADPGPRAGTADVPIDLIAPNPDQPRRHFAEDALLDLIRSIRAKGVLQPLILRPDPAGAGTYQIVAGERRWRAAQRAGLHAVPAIVRDLDDTEVLEIAIVENIQRAGLNPVEEATGYRQLIDRFGHTQEALAEALGKSRSHIANTLRLLNLPEEVLALLRNGKLSAGHARALVPMADPVPLAREAVARGLTVRQVEERARRVDSPAARATRRRAPKDADTRELERIIAAQTGLGVAIDGEPGGPGGRVTLTYRSLDQLDRLLHLLSEGWPDSAP